MQNIATVFFIVLIGLISLYTTKLSREKSLLGEPIKIRRIPAIDHLEEMVGRASEEGKAVFWYPGCYGRMSDIHAVHTGISLSILDYVAGLASKLGSKLICGMKWAEMYTIITDTVRGKYIAAGREAEFEESMVRYISDDYIAMFGGYMGILEREKPSSLILIGSYGLGNILFPEVGMRYGAVAIGGTKSLDGCACFMLGCQYVLITEEMYAVGAYLSNDPLQTSCVVTMDVFRLIGMAILIIGFCISILGNPIMINLLSM